MHDPIDHDAGGGHDPDRTHVLPRDAEEIRQENDGRRPATIARRLSAGVEQRRARARLASEDCKSIHTLIKTRMVIL
jgi:hypothetical protein